MGIENAMTQFKKTYTHRGEATFDLVIRGGRVVDPETALDAVRNVGIIDGSIAEVTTRHLVGHREIDASNLVVAPGFIDLHSHGQAVAELRLQALDGVTTALELEAGAPAMSLAYRQSADEGRPINFGFSASWAALRMHVLSGRPSLDGWTMSDTGTEIGADYWRAPATKEQTSTLLSLLEKELGDGALGIGILLGYAPATDPAEYVQVARIAAGAGVPTFTHARPLVEQDPSVVVDGAEELTRVAGETGAHMHYCHMNSTSTHHLARVQAMVTKVRSEGSRVTSEVYPYGAGMSAIGADYFHPDRLHVLGATGTPSDVIYARTGETVSSVERLLELRERDPGGWAFIKLFDEQKSPERLAQVTALPEAVIASDGVPLVVEAGYGFDPMQWPLPSHVRMHPRGAGTYSRTLRISVRETETLTLSQALAKCSLYPARIVESAAPSMKKKGRLQAGCDADIVVFDPETVTDNATYEQSVLPSTGFSHVLVHGSPIVSNGELIESAMPGRPVRGVR
jgi:N-acyl-D-aspartate/D-glutamate deacylase